MTVLIKANALSATPGDKETTGCFHTLELSIGSTLMSQLFNHAPTPWWLMIASWTPPQTCRKPEEFAV